MLGDTVPYTDLLLRIGAPRPNAAAPSVEAIIDRDSLFYGGTLDLDEQQLLAAEADNQAYGQILMKALFSEPIQRAFDRAAAKAKASTDGRLRIRLQIDDEVARLQAYRWERTSQMFDGQAAPLSTATRTPFSRFTGLEEASAEPLMVNRIRMSVCISNPDKLPDGFVPVRVEDEVRNLQMTIGSLRQTFQRLEVTIAAGRTQLPKDLLDSLASDGYKLLDGPLTLDVLVDQFLNGNIVHFLGHGVFRPDAVSGGGTAALYLEKQENGELNVIRDDDLLPRLRGAAELPHLVVLMACEGARRAGIQPFVGLAGKLVKAGVPALLAMQTKVPMDDAAELTKRFYASLLATGIVDFAANEGRSYLYDSHKSDFSIPALFMRLQNGQLLAPDPVLSALKAIVAGSTRAAQLLPLPIDVVRTTGTPTQAELERLSATGEPPLDLQKATRSVFLDGDRPKKGFVLLFGGQGTAKSSHLKHVAYTTALDADSRIIPVYVNLVDYFGGPQTLGDPLDEFLRRCLERYWPGLTMDRFTEMLSTPTSPQFRFLIDGSDELSEHQRGEVLQRMVDFAEQFAPNQYLLASDFSYADDVIRVTSEIVQDILVIKPISQSRAEEYLTKLGQDAATDLKGELQDQKLFDLASQPWLLVRMLERARRGTLPKSRASVLKGVVDDSLGKVTGERGMRARAAEALYALAWIMHSRKATSLPLTEAFPIIEGVRGNRGFAVEELFEELVSQSLLAPVGQDRLRFAYSAIQDYCCAQALACMPVDDRTAALDDITARLGRLTLLRWWDDAVVILSGLPPSAGVNSLIELVLYGSGFGEGERIFLGARCIQECGTAKVKPELLGQVVDGLIWRSKIANEPRSSLRIRAIEALVGLQAEAAIPHLTGLAVDKVRKNYINQDDFEYPGVRLAATLALMRMDEPAQRHLWKERPAVARTFDLWRAGKVEELGGLLVTAPAIAAAAVPSTGETPAAAPQPPELSSSIAAFALGQIRTPRAAELLVAGFLNSELPVETRWCITDTLKLIDPTVVNEKVLIPFCDEAGAGLPPEVLKKRQYRYDQLAYLAGLIKSREDKVLQFLDQCVFKRLSVSLKGRAIRAIASIYTPGDGAAFLKYKSCFEQIASGDFSSIPLTQPVDPGDTLYLQLSALEALCDMGDSASLQFLREKRQKWPAEIDRQFFLTSEEIYWRSASNSPK